MEKDFPDGNIHIPMSEEVQRQFYKKMKDVIWAIRVKYNKNESLGTGFCIHPSGLLVTAYHVIVEDENEQPIEISARREKDGSFIQCEVVSELPHFDLAMLKVCCEESDTAGGSSSCQLGKKKGKGKKNISDGHFDYVKVDDNISRSLPVGIEVFVIGLCRTQGFHFLRGVMAYDFEGDDTNYHNLVNKTNLQGKNNKFKDTSFLTTSKYGIIKGSFYQERKMHPNLKYLQMTFGELDDIYGCSGAPIFNSQGKVIGILLGGYYSIYGLSASAVHAFVKHSLKDR